MNDSFRYMQPHTLRRQLYARPPIAISILNAAGA